MLPAIREHDAGSFQRWRRVGAVPVRTDLTPARVPRPVAGFTLVEMLVVILVVAVLMAILVPALAGAKKRAKSAKVLSALGQCHAAVAQYAQEQGGFLPYLARPGNPDAGTLPDADWGGGPAPSYFAGQAALWPTALLAHGVDLSRLPFTSRPQDGPPRIRTYLWMTHAAVARPEYWVGRDPPDFPPPQVFSGVRLDESVFPSNKGLLASVSALEQKSTSWEVGFCDGSASIRSIYDPPVQVPLLRPYGQLDWRVLSTSEGIRGRDY